MKISQKFGTAATKSKLCAVRQDKNTAAVEPNGRRKVIQTKLHTKREKSCRIATPLIYTQHDILC